MVRELNELIDKQQEHLKELLVLLEVQCKMIIAKDVFGLESIIEKVDNQSKAIAQIEVARRKLIGNESLVGFIKQSNDIALKNSYDKLMKTLHDAIEKKNTNELLIKQQLTFTNKMLTIMNPDRQAKIYNSYGSLSK